MIAPVVLCGPRRLRHHTGLPFASEAAARNWAATTRCCTDTHHVVDLVDVVHGHARFLDRAEAFLDEGLYGLTKPAQALRNAAAAALEVGL